MSDTTTPHTPHQPTRRALLQRSVGAGFAAGLTGLAAPTTWANALQDASRSVAQNDWSRVPALFQFSSRRAPLNAANLCPMPTAVWEQQKALATQINADVSMIKRRDFVRGQAQDARQACADMLGVDAAERVAFLRNTTEANAAVINGLRLQPKDEVVIWDQNHGTNNLAWHYRRELRPYVCKTVRMPQRLEKPQNIIDTFMQAITAQTRVVSFSHISNISGIKIPAQALCAAIRAKWPGIHIHIDGAQSWGSLHVNLDAIGCDSYAASAHKWLCGPRGTGILVLRDGVAQRLMPSLYGYDPEYNYPEEELQDSAARFENIGQYDNAAYGALQSAVDFHRQLGFAQIEQRIQSLTRYTLNALDKAGVTTITPKDPALGHGVIVIDMGNQFKAYGGFLALHNAGFASAFVQGYRMVPTPQGLRKDDKQPVYLRICPHVYNTTAEIDEAVAVIQRIHNSAFEIVREVVRFL